MCIQTGMLKRLMFPRFLVLARLFLKIGQDHAVQHTRAFSELIVCPCNQLAGAGRFAYFTDFSPHCKSRFCVLSGTPKESV